MIKWMTSKGVFIGGLALLSTYDPSLRLPSTSTSKCCRCWKWDDEETHSERFLLSSELGCFHPISPSLFVLSLISQWKQMIYVQSSLEFMCYSDKVCGPACVSAYFMSVYWDRRLPTGGHKTLFRGNAKSHQFPIHSLSPAFPYEWWILSS